MTILFICLAAYLVHALIYPKQDKSSEQPTEQPTTESPLAADSRMEPVVEGVSLFEEDEAPAQPAAVNAAPVTLPSRFKAAPANVHPWILAVQKEDAMQAFYETLESPAYLRKALAAA